MSIPIAIPVSSQVIQTKTIFTATFNAPTNNRYDFGIAANKNVEILELKASSHYIIERTNFSMDISEGEFQQSIDVSPAISIKREVPNQLIFNSPFEYVNFVDNLEMYAFFNTNQDGDLLQGSATGILKQIPATVGVLTIRILLQFNIYKIDNQRWIAHFDSAKGNLGAGLALRGFDDPRADE